MGYLIVTTEHLCAHGQMVQETHETSFWIVREAMMCLSLFCNYLFPTASSFLESPDGYTAYVPLYSPLRYSIHFGPFYRFSTGSIDLRDGISQIQASVHISVYEAVIMAEASNVLYSVSGNYEAILKQHDDETYHFSFNITVTGIKYTYT